jgi:hypothetical protein
MPGGFPFGRSVCNVNSPNASANSGAGTSVTGAHNSYGAWTQLVASTAIDACWICIRIQPTQTTSPRALTNIGVGSGGNEIAIFKDLYASGLTFGYSNIDYWLPCSIPAGTRISAQCCQSAAADANNITVILYDGSFTPDGFSGVDSFGVTVGSCSVNDIDPGSSANVKGAWTQIIASTSRDYCGLIYATGQNSTDNFSFAGPGGIDVAIGGSGSEQVILADMGLCKVYSFAATSAYAHFVDVEIPAGTRIAARAQQGNTSSGTRVAGLALYGVYQ